MQSPSIKCIYHFFALLLLITVTACQQNNASSFKDIHGNTVDLAKNGKWLIVNYWASWCDTCSEEIPELNALYQSHHDQTITVVGVNLDPIQDTNKLKEISQTFGIEYPVLASDPNEYLGIGHVPALPSTYVFAPNGQLVSKLLGKQTQQNLEDIMYQSNSRAA